MAQKLLFIKEIYLEHWCYLRDMMDKKIKSHDKRVAELFEFIEVAKEKLVELEKERKGVEDVSC